MSRNRAVPEDDEFLGERHVYEPHRAGLPNMRVYVRELWRRREFGFELSRSSLRAAHFDTAFGQLWLVINPLLLGVVYFILVDVISGAHQDATYFAHLLSGLFAFYYISGSMSTGAKSVTGGGKLIMNTAFPRVLMPLSSTLTAFFRFLPTLLILAVVMVVAGLPFGPHLLLAVPLLAEITLFAAGMAMIFAALQVYFRDASSFLPYFTRIWLYLSPVLWFPEQAHGLLKTFSVLNPLYWLLGSWSELLIEGHIPDAEFLAAGFLFAVVTFAFGWVFFVSREREFAVRL
jgi:ABC-type polysaccharide/polyol phosphate export permease